MDRTLAIPISRQCELLGLARSSYYQEPLSGQSAMGLFLMNLIDFVYTKMPFYGVRRMTAQLRAYGLEVNHKRVARLMRVMGLRGLEHYRSRTSLPAVGHEKYPYLLRNMAITRPNQVWCSDITYIGLPGGYAYMTAVMDWHSRYVLSWEMSNTLETAFCTSALEVALRQGRPDIFNTDQGSQFTSNEYTGILKAHGIAISMDGRGRCFDNIFIERLWRTVKYEEIYLKSYETMGQLRQGLGAYLSLYNQERLHQALNYRTPAAVHFAG